MTESDRRESLAIRLYLVPHMFQTIYRDSFAFKVGPTPRKTFLLIRRTVLSRLHRR